MEQVYDALPAEGHQPNSLLQKLAAQVGSPSLMAARGHGGGGGLLSRAEACANAHSFMLAGFEASATATLFTLLHFAHAAPELQREAAAAAADISSAATEGARRVPASELPAASRPWSVVDGGVQESLRLYPPVLTLPRVVTAPDGLAVRRQSCASREFLFL